MFFHPENEIEDFTQLILMKLLDASLFFLVSWSAKYEDLCIAGDAARRKMISMHDFLEVYCRIVKEVVDEKDEDVYVLYNFLRELRAYQHLIHLRFLSIVKRYQQQSGSPIMLGEYEHMVSIAKACAVPVLRASLECERKIAANRDNKTVKVETLNEFLGMYSTLISSWWEIVLKMNQ